MVCRTLGWHATRSPPRVTDCGPFGPLVSQLSHNVDPIPARPATERRGDDGEPSTTGAGRPGRHPEGMADRPSPCSPCRRCCFPHERMPLHVFEPRYRRHGLGLPGRRRAGSAWSSSPGARRWGEVTSGSTSGRWPRSRRPSRWPTVDGISSVVGPRPRARHAVARRRSLSASGGRDDATIVPATDGDALRDAAGRASARPGARSPSSATRPHCRARFTFGDDPTTRCGGCARWHRSRPSIASTCSRHRAPTNAWRCSRELVAGRRRRRRSHPGRRLSAPEPARRSQSSALSACCAAWSRSALACSSSSRRLRSSSRRTRSWR